MVVVIGAGVAGLAAAQALVAAGRAVVVVDKARGVGGRCATRRIDGQPVDFGVLWFHGTDPDFRAVFDDLPDGERLDGWPHRVVGEGPACHPRALDGERWALRSGATALAKHLAVGLDLRLGARVTAIAPAGDQLRVAIDGGADLLADDVVLSAPPEQCAPLLDGLPDSRDRDVARAVLRLVGTTAALTVMATYPFDAGDPDFDAMLPGDDVVAAIVHDSAKRLAPTRRAMVVQATPAWSRARLDDDPGEWAPLLLDAAAAHVGPWMRSPSDVVPHRWRFARVDPIQAVRSPVLVGSGRARVVLTGEAFSPGSGVEGAFLAGRRAAARLLEG